MVCPQCNTNDTDVIDSRNAIKTVRRRRECTNCHYRFTTFERIERPKLLVIKKDGRRDTFNREKLLRGIEHACEKRNISAATIETIIDAIECTIFAREELEVTSYEIGELVMQSLAKLDKVAYVRFASVYKEFTDITSFADVVEMLDKPKKEQVEDVISLINER